MCEAPDLDGRVCGARGQQSGVGGQDGAQEVLLVGLELSARLQHGFCRRGGSCEDVPDVDIAAVVAAYEAAAVTSNAHGAHRHVVFRKLSTTIAMSNGCNSSLVREKKRN